LQQPSNVLTLNRRPFAHVTGKVESVNYGDFEFAITVSQGVRADRFGALHVLFIAPTTRQRGGHSDLRRISIPPTHSTVHAMGFVKAIVRMKTEDGKNDGAVMHMIVELESVAFLGYAKSSSGYPPGGNGPQANIASKRGESPYFE
jgi:hypothetical protein